MFPHAERPRPPARDRDGEKNCDASLASGWAAWLGVAVSIRSGTRRLSKGFMAWGSSERDGQVGEVGHNEVGLMRCFAEWPLAPVNERRPHAEGFRTDAVEGMIGDK